MDILIEPTVKEAETFVKKAIEKRKVVLIAGNCIVDYWGRASSKLSPGERMIIIKEDGALLVHRSTSYEPVNWMPGTNVIYSVKATMMQKEKSNEPKNDVLEIHAVRQKPPESVKVFFEKIQMVSALSLADSGEFSLYASEEDMQKAILTEPSLLEEGFKIISYEKKVEPGFVDVYGTDKDGRLVVVEIKRKTAGKDAVIQLAKYIDAIKSKADREVRGVLAAPNIAKDVQRLLVTLGLEFKALDPKKCSNILRRTEARKLEAFFTEEQE